MTQTAPPTPPAPRSAPQRLRYLRTFAGALLGLAVAGLATGAWLIDRIWQELPAVDHLATYRPAMPLRIYSRDGVLLAEYGIERREFTPIGQIPLRVRHALLATEDARFYEHGPVDFGAIVRATLTNLVAGHSAQGGSTISMQVARNFYLTREKLVSRKLTEILMAYKLEMAYSKDKLLELYMNQIYLGERAYGFAAASSIYFGKPLDRLTDAEAAVLAGLPKAPSVFNPAVNPVRAKGRRQYVLRRMCENGYLDADAYRQAVDAPFVLASTPPPGIVAAPYVAEYARRMIVERYHDDAYTLGLDVTTTVTMREQLAAEAALRHAALDAQMRAGATAGQAAPLEGALVSLDAHTGDILALSGGMDFRRNPFDHALQAYRQPGSSFKPFVYSAALEKGFFPGTLVDDTQRTLSKEETGANSWRPRNYADNYEGFIPMRRGLVRSKNVVAVSLMQAAQASFVQRHALAFGFDDVRNPASLTLALGAGAATPLQLASAYSAFANGGLRAGPRLIGTVQLRNGDVLFRAPSPAQIRTIPARNAFVMDSMLRDVVRSGTARGALSLGRADTAGKTGTSNGSKDVWFAGYSSGVVTAVWLGYDVPRSLGSATAATLALPVWLSYMKVAVDGHTPVDPAMPPGLVLADGDFVYAEYATNDRCIDAPPPFIKTRYVCGRMADGGPGLHDDQIVRPKPPPPVDAAERAQVLNLFRTAD